MRNYEVELDKPSQVKDFCDYDYREITITKETTTSIVAARDVEHLKEKLARLYPGIRIIKYRFSTLDPLGELDITYFGGNPWISWQTA